jgi:tetratricopeptide (TPR) repeat protein
MSMGVSVPTTLAGWSKGARLYEGLGTFHRRISTHSPEAQLYFDQGMRFLWAFNHDESTRSFARALQIDPTCAMCAWGVALTVGPNYNMLMLAEPRAKIAFEATTRAQSLAGRAMPVEQALIATLSQRYLNAKPLDPQTAGPILAAHAAAMRVVAQRFPDDLDVQTLYAESMMNIHAWKLWGPDGTPTEGTPEIVATLESVLKRDPNHMGAAHYYIHAVEASPHPEKGLAAAASVGAAGHLQHMPAHIMQRLGRYEDAAEANRKAAAADVGYLAKTSPIDYYPTMYASHNFQFLAFSTAAEARKRLAQFDSMIAGVPADAPARQNLLRNVLAVARLVAAARISSAEGRRDDTLRDLREAVRLEDGLAYDEPSNWFFPVRNVLGMELLRDGKAQDAERVYREDLTRNSGSGWSLYGLMLALKAGGRGADASALEAQFREAWRHATISISASAF